VNGPDATPTPAPDATSPSVATTSPPVWFQMIEPFLPEGFEHVAINGVAPGYIRYTAIRRATNQSLQIEVRTGLFLDGEIAPEGTDPAGQWIDDDFGSTLIRPDGVRISVECGIGNVGGTLGDFRDYCGPGYEHLGVDYAARREMVAAIASGFPFDMIDPSTMTTTGTDLPPVRALMEAALTDQTWAGHGGLAEGDVVFFQFPGRSDGGTAVTILHGVYPPDDTDGADGLLYGYGTASVGWIISGGTATRIFSSETEQQPRENLANLLSQIQAEVTGVSPVEQRNEELLRLNGLDQLQRDVD
jgi:hypothetical protein